MKKMNRCYSELILLDTFEKRFDYLKLTGIIGKETFGYDRYLNQNLYSSPRWKRVRDKVIIRDMGCDLGLEGYEIQYDKILIHHMNPITKEQILNNDSYIYNLENLICTSIRTHNAIHYSDKSILLPQPIGRSKNDTCPWKQ